MIEENKYCSDVMKKHFNKELVITIKYNDDFENLTKRWISDYYYIENDVKVRDHCHITGNVFHIEIVISILNEIIKLLAYFTTLKIMIHILLCKD